MALIVSNITLNRTCEIKEKSGCYIVTVLLRHVIIYNLISGQVVENTFRFQSERSQATRKIIVKINISLIMIYNLIVLLLLSAVFYTAQTCFRELNNYIHLTFVHFKDWWRHGLELQISVVYSRLTLRYVTIFKQTRHTKKTNDTRYFCSCLFFCRFTFHSNMGSTKHFHLKSLLLFLRNTERF